MLDEEVISPEMDEKILSAAVLERDAMSVGIDDVTVDEKEEGSFAPTVDEPELLNDCTLPDVEDISPITDELLIAGEEPGDDEEAPPVVEELIGAAELLEVMDFPRSSVEVDGPPTIIPLEDVEPPAAPDNIVFAVTTSVCVDETTPTLPPITVDEVLEVTAAGVLDTGVEVLSTVDEPVGGADSDEVGDVLPEGAKVPLDVAEAIEVPPRTTEEELMVAESVATDNTPPTVVAADEVLPTTTLESVDAAEPVEVDGVPPTTTGGTLDVAASVAVPVIAAEEVTEVVTSVVVLPINTGEALEMAEFDAVEDVSPTIIEDPDSVADSVAVEGVLSTEVEAPFSTVESLTADDAPFIKLVEPVDVPEPVAVEDAPPTTVDKPVREMEFDVEGPVIDDVFAESVAVDDALSTAVEAPLELAESVAADEVPSKAVEEPPEIGSLDEGDVAATVVEEAWPDAMRESPDEAELSDEEGKEGTAVED